MDYVSTVIQQPVGSGFGAHTTAAEVLAGHDLTGQHVLVTGGYSGIGVETVRAFANAGAVVHAPARRPDQAASALAGIDRVEIAAMDLGDMASVAAYADSLLSAGNPLSIIVNNAGIMALPETRNGPDGWEAQFAVNHLGHFALTNRLLPLLTRPGRVVSVTSLGHHYTAMRWDDPHFRNGYDKWLAYGQSKTACMLFALALDRRGRAEGITAYSCHPGAILTNLGQHLTESDLMDMLVNEDGTPFDMPEFKSPEAGAATAVYAATATLPGDRGGAYLEDCDIAGWSADGRTATGAKTYALDDAEADRLWEWSAQLTGVDYFGS